MPTLNLASHRWTLLNNFKYKFRIQEMTEQVIETSRKFLSTSDSYVNSITLIPICSLSFDRAKRNSINRCSVFVNYEIDRAIFARICVRRFKITHGRLDQG